MANLKETNEALFEALNLLKAQTFVYEKTNRDEYWTLCQNRDEVNDILGYDACKMEHLEEFRAVKIGFLNSDGDKWTNRLKAKLTADDMRVYAGLLTIYNERYISEGAFISTIYPELEHAMVNACAVIKPSYVRSGDTVKNDKGKTEASLKKFASFNMLEYDQKTQAIQLFPGVRLGIDSSEFARFFESRVQPWIDRKNEEVKEETITDEA